MTNLNPEPGPRARPGRRAEAAGIALLLALAAWFYFWTATSAGSPLTSGLAPDDLYNRLADGFLAGRASFAEDPPPELATLADPYDPAQNAPYKKYHDVSYYRGRYHLYFGPTPALVLLAPWKALTGAYLPQNLGVAVFAWGAALVSVLLLRGLRDRHFPAIPAWMLLASAAAVTFGNMLPVLLRRPIHYELAIACACFFGLGALGCFFKAQAGAGRPRQAWLAGAGLGLGLAIAARPDYLLGAAALIAAWVWSMWSKERSREPAAWFALLRQAAPLLLPLVLVGVGLLIYNRVRFDSWLEFGMKYQLAGGSQLDLKFMSPWFLLPNLYYYLVALPHISSYFPFILVTGMPPFALPKGYSGQENMYGLLFSLPWLLALFWLKQGVQRGWPAAGAGVLREFALASGAMVAAILGFLLLIAGANNRYLVDFVPAATVLAGAGVFLWETRAPTGWRKWLGRAAWTAALAWTVVFNITVSLQHNELLRYHNPATYRKLAYAANHLSHWRPAGESGPLRIDLTLPKNRTGKLEPLLVTGASFRADFLYVFYKDETHIQIGFEHTSYGGPMSPPLEVDYDVPHVLEVQLGSLFPPVEHPYYDGKAPEEINRLKRTLLIKLDGRVVHSGQFDFYDSSPGDVSVGRNHVSDAFGRRFTGVVRSVTRPASIE